MESLALLNVEDCASARWANELNLSSASKGERNICHFGCVVLALAQLIEFSTSFCFLFWDMFP